MRIIEMRPEVTPWRDGQHRRASSWSFTDSYQSIGGHVRSIYHYQTLMGEYVGFERTFDHDRGESVLEWTFNPISVGWGSVSDQNGMNMLMSWKYHYGVTYQDYGYYFVRRGGARIIATAGGDDTVVVD